MVSALDSGASGLGWSPCRGRCVVFLGKTLTLTVPLFTQVYKWVPVNCWGNLTKLRRSDLRWTSIPSRERGNTSSRFMLQKPGYAPAAMSQPCSNASLWRTVHTLCGRCVTQQSTLSHFGFLFAKNSGGEITWLSCIRFRKAPFSYCISSAGKRKVGVSEFLWRGQSRAWLGRLWLPWYI